MMGKHFLSVIFCNTKYQQTAVLEKLLSRSSLLKVFTPVDVEEIQQIVNMSLRTALVFDLETYSGIEIKVGPDYFRGDFRKYLLNWSTSDQKVYSAKKGPDNVTVLLSGSIESVIEKIELYLFGIANVYQKESFVESELSKSLGTTFFTHFEKIGIRWQVTVSTHEREWDVSEKLGVDWEELLDKVLTYAESYTQPVEEILTRPYYQVIYPHAYKGSNARISIVHLVYDSDIKKNLSRIYNFLQSI